MSLRPCLSPDNEPGPDTPSPCPLPAGERVPEAALAESTPIVVIHSLDHARAALGAAQALGVAVTLASAAGAGAYAGPAWFRAVVALAAAEFPAARFTAVLDCADEAGTVLAALRQGVKRVRFSGSPAAAARLADIAAQHGAVIEHEAPAHPLDLLDRRDAPAACRAFLAGNAASP